LRTVGGQGTARPAIVAASRQSAAFSIPLKVHPAFCRKPPHNFPRAPLRLPPSLHFDATSRIDKLNFFCATERYFDCDVCHCEN
jgi:hypothetical protein